MVFKNANCSSSIIHLVRYKTALQQIEIILDADSVFKICHCYAPSFLLSASLARITSMSTFKAVIKY